DPDQCANPCRQLVQLQDLTRRKRIKVADKHVKTILMTFDSFQQRPDLAPAPAFIPTRKPRAQMQTKHTCVSSSRNDLQERMPRPRRIVPLVISHFPAAQKSYRMIPPRRPERKSSRGGDTFDHLRMRRFLKNDEIGRSGFDRLSQGLFASHS